MQNMEKSDMRQKELQDLVQEAGVEELMDLYRKVEEVYVAAHGAGTPIPLDIITDSTNLSTRNV